MSGGRKSLTDDDIVKAIQRFHPGLTEGQLRLCAQILLERILAGLKDGKTVCLAEKKSISSMNIGPVNIGNLAVSLFGDDQRGIKS